MMFEVLGVFLAALIQGIIISIYGSKISCDDQTTISPKATLPFDNYTSPGFYSTTTQTNPGYGKLVIKIFWSILKTKIRFNFSRVKVIW